VTSWAISDLDERSLHDRFPQRSVLVRFNEAFPLKGNNDVDVGKYEMMASELAVPNTSQSR